VPRLIVHEGSDHDKGKVVDLPPGRTFVIGRDPSADVPVYDGRVSRQHVRLETHEDGVHAVDLKSKNGSFINNAPLTEHLLRPGDHLRVGDTVFVFMADAAPSGRKGGADTVAQRLKTFYRAQTERQIPAVAAGGPLRLIAFDIEGTLLTTDGQSIEILEQTLREVCSLIKPFEGIPLAGRTEPEIVRNVLKAADMPQDRIKIERPRILTRYANLFGNMLRKRPRGNILPGVRDLLDRLCANSHWAVSLFTRKTSMTARLLLGHHGLLDKFPYGVFADDRELRETLPPLLLERAREATGVAFEPKDTWIVGDSVRDVAIAKEAGMKAVAVATGSDSYEVLANLKPDLLFHAFEHVDEVLLKLNAGLPAAR
jgi:phosphoglycolate phosphatase-like HAD superfamily hydrolase